MIILSSIRIGKFYIFLLHSIFNIKVLVHLTIVMVSSDRRLRHILVGFVEEWTVVPPAMIHNMLLMILTNPSAFYGYIFEALAIRCVMWWCVCIGVQLCVILVIKNNGPLLWYDFYFSSLIKRCQNASKYLDSFLTYEDIEATIQPTSSSDPPTSLIIWLPYKIFMPQTRKDISICYGFVIWSVTRTLFLLKLVWETPTHFYFFTILLIKIFLET
jgi:hypothetical protein